VNLEKKWHLQNVTQKVRWEETLSRIQIFVYVRQFQERRENIPDVERSSYFTASRTDQNTGKVTDGSLIDWLEDIRWTEH